MCGSERGVRANSSLPAGPRRLRSPSRSLAPFAGLVLTLGLMAATPASGQPVPPVPPVRRVGLNLMVSHASVQPGPVDPAAARLHESLRKEFRYESLRVIERRRLSLRAGEIGGLELPSGKRVRVRPLHLGPGGVLLAVDIENTLHTDMRLPDRRPVVIGVDRYQGGKLILTVESEMPDP